MSRCLFAQGVLDLRNFMAAASDTPLGIATLIVRSGLMVIDRYLAFEDAAKSTGPRDGMSMVVACGFNEQSP